MTFAKRQLPGHCLAIMLASWRGQSLVPAGNVAGLERAFNPARHPDLRAKDVLSEGTMRYHGFAPDDKVVVST